VRRPDTDETINALPPFSYNQPPAEEEGVPSETPIEPVPEAPTTTEPDATI